MPNANVYRNKKKILFREAGLGWGWGMGGLNLFDTCLSNYCEASLYSKPA